MGIMTERLTTAVVILPRGTESDFLSSYESMCDNVVPMSARKFSDHDDKDGNSLWRVVMLKSVVEEFKRKCREKRFVPRDFEYSQDAYTQLVAQRGANLESVEQQHDRIKGLCQ